MLNDKNMFTYKIKKMNTHKDSTHIIPDEPSNIFDCIEKRRKIVNFDEIMGFINRKKINELEIASDSEISKLEMSSNSDTIYSKYEKKTGRKNIRLNENNKKRQINTKMNQERKIVNLDLALKKNSDLREIAKEKIPNAKKEKKQIANENLENIIFKENILNVQKIQKKNLRTNLKTENIENPENITKNINVNKRVNLPILPEIPKLESISDVLLLFCKLNISNKYACKLKQLVDTNKNIFDDFENKEILEDKIEQMDEEKNKWSVHKDNILKKNILNLDAHEKLSTRCQQTNNIILYNKSTESNYFSNMISGMLFLKNSMRIFLNNMATRVDEAVTKIYNINNSEVGLDSMILLQAFTKYTR